MVSMDGNTAFHGRAQGNTVFTYGRAQGNTVFTTYGRAQGNTVFTIAELKGILCLL